MSNLILTAGVQNIPQPEPKEGRLALELGLNSVAGVVFPTGSEVYQWNTSSLQSAQRMSAIISVWYDATAVATGKFLIIQVGRQIFQLAGGTQGYFICTPPMPTNIIVSTNNGAGVTVQAILYNYNVLYTGISAGAGAGGGAGGAGGAGGGLVRGGGGSDIIVGTGRY